MIFVLASAFARAFVLAALALATMPLLSRAPAVLRRGGLGLALGLSLVAPIVSAVAPAGIVPPSLVLVARAPFAEPVEHASAAPAVVLADSPRERSPLPSFSSVVVAVWASIAALLVGRLVGSRVRASRLGRRGLALAPDVTVTSDVDGPVVVGAFAPRILLPPRAIEWTEERLRVVLEHERAHVASRDGLVRLIADVACAVYWPVPTVWPASKRLVRECELAADERAVRSGIAATTVAQHLVEVAREALAPAPTSTFGMASELERRVTALLSGRTSNWSPRASTATLTGIGAGLSLAACSLAGPYPD